MYIKRWALEESTAPKRRLRRLIANRVGDYLIDPGLISRFYPLGFLVILSHFCPSLKNLWLDVSSLLVSCLLMFLCILSQRSLLNLLSSQEEDFKSKEALLGHCSHQLVQAAEAHFCWGTSSSQSHSASPRRPEYCILQCTTKCPLEIWPI